MNNLARKFAITLGLASACATAAVTAVVLSMPVLADSPMCEAGVQSTADAPCTTPDVSAGSPSGGGTDSPAGGSDGTTGGGSETPPPPPTPPTGGDTGGSPTTGDGTTTGGGTSSGDGTTTTGGGSDSTPTGGSDTGGDPTTTTGGGDSTHTGTTGTHHPGTHQPAPHKPGTHKPGTHKPGTHAGTTTNKGNNNGSQRHRAAMAQQSSLTHTVAVQTFADARTFRDAWKPEGRLREAPQLSHDTLQLISDAAKASGVNWQLLTTIAWADSRWGDRSAGVFIGQRLSSSDWITYGTDADGDGMVTRASVTDQLATVAARLAAVPGTDGDRLHAYFGDHAKAIAHARLIEAYHHALGLDAIEKGLSDPSVAAELQARVLADERVHLYPGGQSDVQAGIIDPRVLVSIEFLADRFNTITVSCLVSGHSVFTKSGNVSLHAFGQAVDIAALNEIPIYGHQAGPGNITVRALKDLLRLPESMQPQELISLWALGGPSFALTDHDDHIHLGFGSAAPVTGPITTGTDLVPVVGSGVAR